MKKWGLLIGCLALWLSGCVEYDESTYITDDVGQVHHTVHFTRDRRGQDYFPKTIPAPGHRVFVFDPQAYAWAAYDAYGVRRMTGAASGGMDYCLDAGKPCRTVTGTFRVYNKRGINCVSKEFPVDTGGSKMPYCMYFSRGYSIHAGYDIPFANVSHGCIRVWPSAAKWLNEDFMQIGTEVIVRSYADENGNDKAD